MAATQEDELAVLREQRRIELQKQLEEQAQQQADAEVAQQAAQREAAAIDSVIKQILTSEARGRLARIAMADPSRVEQVKKALVEMNSRGQINGQLNDEQLKSLLQSHSKSRHSASIRRI